MKKGNKFVGVAFWWIMKHRYSLLLVATMLLLVGCNSDLHYANSFIRKFEQQRPSAVERIYVSLPTALIHTNSTVEGIRWFEYMPSGWQDSVVAANTAILNEIDDSIFLAQFGQALLFTLSRLQVPIVVVDDAAQLPVPSDSVFTLCVPQLEAEEWLQPTRSDFHTRQGDYYYYDYELRHFAAHVWLRFGGADTLAPLYYRQAATEEHFHGAVTQIRDGRARMRTSFERIGVGDAYRTARRLGAECATLYVERLLTEYVCRTKGTNASYFYYNPSYNTIDRTLPYDEGIKEGFERL